jgi:tetrahydromethanopterin S-methyltransferase subunit H
MDGDIHCLNCEPERPPTLMRESLSERTGGNINKASFPWDHFKNFLSSNSLALWKDLGGQLMQLIISGFHFLLTPVCLLENVFLKNKFWKNKLFFDIW